MLFAILGQILLWLSINLMQAQSTSETSSLGVTAIFCSIIAILFAKVKRIGRYKSIKRRNVAPSTQSKILNGQITGAPNAGQI